jgi:WD40 repeat protein
MKPIISLALHPSRKNILVIVQRSSSNLLIYDTLKASSVLRNVSLADGARVSSSGDATALAFHPTGSHFAVVGENEVLHIVNVATGSVRVRQLRKGPLTGVGWTSKTGLAIGTESGEFRRIFVSGHRH